MTRRNRIVLGIASLSLAAGLGYAIRASALGIPATNALSYAGVLEDATGPITGSHNIQVILYDAATAGNNLCQSLTLNRWLAQAGCSGFLLYRLRRRCADSGLRSARHGSLLSRLVGRSANR